MNSKPSKRKRRTERKKAAARPQDVCVMLHTKDTPIRSDLRKMYGKRYVDASSNMEFVCENAQLVNWRR